MLSFGLLVFVKIFYKCSMMLSLMSCLFFVLDKVQNAFPLTVLCVGNKSCSIRKHFCVSLNNIDGSSVTQFLRHPIKRAIQLWRDFCVNRKEDRLSNDATFAQTKFMQTWVAQKKNICANNINANNVSAICQ